MNPHIVALQETLQAATRRSNVVTLPKGWRLAKGRHSGLWVCSYEDGMSVVTTTGETGREAAQEMRKLLANRTK